MIRLKFEKGTFVAGFNPAIPCTQRNDTFRELPNEQHPIIKNLINNTIGAGGGRSMDTRHVYLGHINNAHRIIHGIDSTYAYAWSYKF